MRTITYYSYKGGVGRTLLVANTAKYLSTLGKTVFALDLDLEAPGLNYKFELDRDTEQPASVPGIVDILVAFLKNQALPRSLDEYFSEVGVAIGAGSIRIMRAGTAPSSDYWKLLSRVNWYEMFYGPDPVGVPFFLELKARILQDYKPDFFLIDARTGITEMGGIATTLLPDSVVCLALTSVEHLEGLRAVMHGIRQTSLRAGTTVELLPVISRLSQRKDESLELTAVRQYLNLPIKDGGASLDLEELMTLHAEPLLDTREQLLVGGKNSPHELLLLRDYLKLFSKVIPAEEIRPHVGELISRAVSLLLDDPDAAQSALETLTTYCADQDAYRALLKLYQVRGTPIEKIVPTASLMWQLDGARAAQDKLVIDIVKAGFSEPRPGAFQKKYAEFAEAVWRAGDMTDIRIALTLVQAYMPESRPKAIQLLSDYISAVSPPQESAIIKLIELLIFDATPHKAFQLIDRFKHSIKTPEFYAAWARLMVDQQDKKQIFTLLQDPLFNQEALRVLEPVLLYKLLKLARMDGGDQLLNQTLEVSVSKQDMGTLVSIAEVFAEEGRLQEFEARLAKGLPQRLIEGILEDARAGSRRLRNIRSRPWHV